MIVRSTFLAEIKACPQRAYFGYDLGLSPKKGKKSIDLVFGSVVHKALELFHTEGMDAALSVIEKADFDQTRTKNKHHARTLLEVYASSRPPTLVAVERDFSFKIGRHTWRGRFDGVTKHLGQTFIVEFKTTNPFFLKSKPNDQLIAYWGGGSIIFSNLGGILLIDLDPSSLTVKRSIVSFTRDEFLRWRDETKAVLAFYQRCLTTKVFPKNPGACKLYGRNCPFMVLCTSPPDIHERIISDYFEVSEENLNKSW